MAAAHICMQVDVQPALDFIDDATALFEAFEFPREVVNRFLDLLQSREEFVFFQVDDIAAAGAGQLTMRLYPGDRLRHFLAALRAGNRDLAFIESAFGHGGPPL